MIKETFIKLLNKYTKNSSMINNFWLEVEQNYSDGNRCYHNLNHLENILIELKEVKNQINNWDCILFTLFYHDIVYDTTRTNNEEVSAEFAGLRMKKINCDPKEIHLCKEQILATKKHLLSSNADTNYFIDADLSILGMPWKFYSEYFRNIKKEYALFPDEMYTKGRVEVLHHFLKMEKIYKTEYFFTKFEAQAKINLKMELEELLK